MRTNFLFGTQAKARAFRSELRKQFILTREITPYFVEIAYFDDIRDELKDRTLRAAEKAYAKIGF